MTRLVLINRGAMPNMAKCMQRHNQQRPNWMNPQVPLTPDEIAYVKEVARRSKRISTGKRIAGVVAVLGVVFAAGAFFATLYGAASTHKATQIQEAMSLLSVEPSLEVHAAFPPRILLWNNGKVDALAVTVEMVVWEGGTHPSGVPYKWAWRTQTPEWVLGDIAPSQHRIIPVSSPRTQPSPVLPEEIRKERHRFIELIVRYLRAADRKSYDQRSYYFVGTTGEWVSENGSQADIAFTRRIQQSIKDEGFWNRPWRLPDFDPVHVKSE